MDRIRATRPFDSASGETPTRGALPGTEMLATNCLLGIVRQALNATFLPSRQADDTVPMYAAKAYMSLAIHILSRTGCGSTIAARLIVGP